MFINDLVSELPRGVKAALYADDLILWYNEEHASTANYRIQQAIDQLTAWTEDWQCEIYQPFHSVNKTSPTLGKTLLLKSWSKPQSLNLTREKN